MLGYNMFVYANNNPVMFVDPTGEAWWHWALAAAVVVACAAATVATCGMSLGGAAMAISMVASGSAALTTASTVAAAATIGSALTLGALAVSAAANSSSVNDFNEQGNWGTVLTTAVGATAGAYDGYRRSNSQKVSFSNGGDSFNLKGKKDADYVTSRKWTSQNINTAIADGRKGISINKATNMPCTVYCYPNTNYYVVIEDATGSLVQASEFGNANWIPDNTIIWDKR